MDLSSDTLFKAQGIIKLKIKLFLEKNNLIYDYENLEDISDKLMNYVIYRADINESINKYMIEALFTFEFYLNDYLKNKHININIIEMFLINFDPVKETISHNVYDLIHDRFNNFDCNDISTIIGHLIFEDYKSNIFCLTKTFINSILRNYLYRLLNIGEIYDKNPTLHVDNIIKLETRRCISPFGVDMGENYIEDNMSDITEDND